MMMGSEGAGWWWDESPPEGEVWQEALGRREREREIDDGMGVVG